MINSLKNAAHRISGGSFFNDVFRPRRAIQRLESNNARALSVSPSGVSADIASRKVIDLTASRCANAAAQAVDSDIRESLSVIPDFARVKNTDRDFAEITGELNVLSLSKAVREIRMTSSSQLDKPKDCDPPAHLQLASLLAAGGNKLPACKASCQCSTHASLSDFCRRRVEMLKNATVLGSLEVECLDILKTLVRRMITLQQSREAAEFAHIAVSRVCVLPARDRIGHGKALLFAGELMEMVGHYQSAASFYKGAYRILVKELGERHALTEKAGCRHLQILRDVGWECSAEKMDKTSPKACKCSCAPVYKLDPQPLLS